jgi:sigma-B regulation protein RsbU (phosphoserine phosphatase)
MSLCVTMLRVVLQLEFAPVQLLHHINGVLNKHYDESQMFASIFVAYVDFETGEVDYANGGHNAPLLYRAATDTFELLKARGVVIGLFDEAVFGSNKVVLQPDDVLVMYTDGVIEAQNASGEQFEMERLQTVVRQTARQSVNDIKSAIIAAVNDFAFDQEPFDDQTLLIVKREPA